MFHNEFYPTPRPLIEKMMGLIDTTKVKTILEPSAGKGDIVDYLRRKYDSTYNRLDIDTIEITEELRHILKGKNFRVVGDDFLSLHTHKCYDLIVMNPPFSNGDKHLLKALKMLQETGGQVVCLLNAETIKNPYTNTKQDLVRQLDELGAKIEYLDSTFSTAERKTNVEVALIYANIVIEKKQKSIILDNFEQTERHKNDDRTERHDVASSDLLNAIVDQYNYEVAAGVKLIKEFYTISELSLQSFESDKSWNHSLLELKVDGGSSKHEKENTIINKYVQSVRKKYWSTLFNSKGFQKLLTNSLRSELYDKMEELANYDFSLSNINSLRIELNKTLIDSVENTIIKLFDDLSYKHHYNSDFSKNIHLYNGWKTNAAHRINKKVIIPFYDAYSSFSKRYEPASHYCASKLGDIEKVLNYLDNGRTDSVDLKAILEAAQKSGQNKKIRTKYFEVSFFLKGTCHLTFLDEELLKKFNIYGSQKKGWLPPHFGSKKYSDMVKEEQDVINSFMGEKAYNDVLNKQEFFLGENTLLALETSA